MYNNYTLFNFFLLASIHVQFERSDHQVPKTREQLKIIFPSSFVVKTNNHKMESSYIGFWVIAIVCMVCTLVVIILLMVFGSKSTACKLILCLNVTTFLLDFASLPNIFCNNFQLCAFIGFVKNYCGLANSITGVCVAMQSYFILFSQKSKRKSHLKKYFITIFVFPLITVLPFIDDCYGPLYKFCGIMIGPQSEQVPTNWKWSIATFHVWLWICQISIIILLVKLRRKLQMDPSKEENKIAKSLRVYGMMSVIFWLPRCFQGLFLHIDQSEIFSLSLMTYFLGLFHFIYFVSEFNMLKVVETHYKEKVLVPPPNTPGVSIDLNQEEESTGYMFDDNEESDIGDLLLTRSHLNDRQRPFVGGGSGGGGADSDARGGQRSDSGLAMGSFFNFGKDTRLSDFSDN